MLKNYLKIAIRNLWKNKLFSLINIGGLGLAMTFCFIQLIQVQSSFEKDSFHPFPDRTFRILTDATDNNGKVYSLASTPFPLGQKLLDEQSVVEKAVRINRAFSGDLNNGVKTLKTYGLYADSSFFDVFGFKLERGTPAIAPRTCVVTRDLAERFFGNANPVGKTLTNAEMGTFTITGVFKPIAPFESHLDDDIVLSFATLPLTKPDLKTNNWLDYNTYTFVLLTKGTPRAALDRALAGVANDNRKTVDFKEIKGHIFRSQALTEISPDYENLLNNPGIEPIWKIGVGLLIPLIIITLAGFNYINLTLTRSLGRAREVGVRKVAGAKRRQLVIQFLIETMLIALLALCIGYVGLILMQANIHVRWLTWEVNDTRILWAVFLGFTLLTGLLAGLLPARILSGYQPVNILKGETVAAGLGKLGFRKALTIIQFVVALVFMTGTGIMNSQFKYMATDNDNFNRKNILNIPLTADSDFKLLGNEMGKQAGVKRIGVASATFSETAGKVKLSKTTEKAVEAAKKDAYVYSADAGFIQNMKLKFVAGTNMPVSRDTSIHFVVLNQNAVRTLGWKDPKDIVGQSIMLNQTEVIVSGVVKDFCFMRYELPVAPLVLAFDQQEIGIISLEIEEGTDPGQIEASLANVWKRFHPHESFVSSWYEQQLYDRYIGGGDQQLMDMMIFVVFAIATTGLLGMVTYATARRVKEVGVRKVMGASVTQIMHLLSASFVKMILIAAVIALPIGYLLGSLFLNIFTYHTKLGPGVFFTCVGVLLTIGLLTIGIQTYKAAITNPAETLRDD
ncbi:putative ABC transport system permease protein [Dyadobacter sp. SG02]|uniref:ABC transporter permease n=1 Tax=Dyadobacter sp. SG02 TaxID=1855291 RepID=UPI0008B0D3AE|nr:ABC transporter permease [Dyadobacter sp. SG02]SEI43898.1 putative ABC transport system permease protein [Dyadobacter sp. SG02]